MFGPQLSIRTFYSPWKNKWNYTDWNKAEKKWQKRKLQLFLVSISLFLSHEKSVTLPTTSNSQNIFYARLRWFLTDMKNSKCASWEMETSLANYLWRKNFPVPSFSITSGNTAGSDNNNNRYVSTDEEAKIFLGLVHKKISGKHHQPCQVVHCQGLFCFSGL